MVTKTNIQRVILGLAVLLILIALIFTVKPQIGGTTSEANNPTATPNILVSDTARPDQSTTPPEQPIIPTSTPNTISTLGRIMARNEGRGELRCGINGALKGFSWGDGDNSEGLDAAYCKALKIAIGAESVKFIALNSKDRFNALLPGKDGEGPLIDVLFRNTSRTAVRDTLLGVKSGPTYFYDDQRIMVHSSLGVTTTEQFVNLYSPSKICVLPDTTTYDGLIARFGESVKLDTMSSTLAIFDNNSLFLAYFSTDNNNGQGQDKKCNAISSDYTQLLTNMRDKIPEEQHSEYIFLDSGDQGLGNEFYSPFVSSIDPIWLDIVTWVVYAPMQAAELGITSDTANCPQNDPVRQKLLCNNPVFSTLGLRADSVHNIVSSEGNYEEMFDKYLYDMLADIRSHIDQDNAFNIKSLRDADLTGDKEARAKLRFIIAGPNKLATKGGGQLAPPPVGSPPTTPTPAQ